MHLNESSASLSGQDRASNAFIMSGLQRFLHFHLTLYDTIHLGERWAYLSWQPATEDLVGTMKMAVKIPHSQVFMKHSVISIICWALCQHLRALPVSPSFSLSFKELQVLTLILQGKPTHSNMMINHNGHKVGGEGVGVAECRSKQIHAVAQWVAISAVTNLQMTEKLYWLPFPRFFQTAQGIWTTIARFQSQTCFSDFWGTLDPSFPFLTLLGYFFFLSTHFLSLFPPETFSFLQSMHSLASFLLYTEQGSDKSSWILTGPAHTNNKRRAGHSSVRLTHVPKGRWSTDSSGYGCQASAVCSPGTLSSDSPQTCCLCGQWLAASYRIQMTGIKDYK